MKLARAFAVATLPALAACATSWPTGSYVSASDGDAHVLASAISDYVTRTLPTGSAVQTVSAGANDPIAPLLSQDMQGSGLVEKPGGHRVSYIIAPLDDGVLLRASIDDAQGASRLYQRDGGSVVPGGPLMVASP